MSGRPRRASEASLKDLSRRGVEAIFGPTMIDFGEMTDEGARAYCDAYVLSLPSRHNWLASELVASGLGAQVLSSPEDLPVLWRHVEQVVQRDGRWRLRTRQPATDLQQGPRPPWYQAEPLPNGADPFTDETLWLIELLGAHLARLVLEVAPEAHWGLYRVPKRLNDVNQNKTVLLDVPSGWFADPTGMIYSVMLSRFFYRRKSYSGMDTLADVFQFITTPRASD